MRLIYSIPHIYTDRFPHPRARTVPTAVTGISTQPRCIVATILLLILFATCVSFVGCSSKSKHKTYTRRTDTIPPQVVSITPADGSNHVSLDSSIRIVFSEPIDISSIKLNRSTVNCDQPVQVSSDNFETCLPLNEPIPEKNNTMFTFVPRKKFSYLTDQTRYVVKVKQQVRDAAGNGLEEDYNMSRGFTLRFPIAYPGLVHIPDGEFKMGSRFGDDDELPLRTVVLKEYYISDHEVTAAEFGMYIEETLNTLRSGANHTFNVPGKENYPINYVSWQDARNFVHWLNKKTMLFFRLCSEAEWEYAARAGTRSRYSCGDNDGCLHETAWFNANNRPHGLKSTRAKHANPWGLFDMHGNAWEWVQDTYHYSYQANPADGKAREDKKSSLRVLRGGSYYMSAYGLRSANRGFFPEMKSGPGIGFRLCADAEKHHPDPRRSPIRE